MMDDRLDRNSSHGGPLVSTRKYATDNVRNSVQFPFIFRSLLCDGPDKLDDDGAGGPYDELQISSSSSSSSLQANNNTKPLYARRGKHLCNMGRERFVAEAPPFLGDILWEHLEMMQRGNGDIII